MKKCNSCAKFLDDNHYRGRKDRGTKRTVCRDCENASNLLRYHTRTKTQEAHRRASYKYTIKKYGLTIEHYEKLYVNQNGCCFICKEPQERLHVDHDHKTGKVRSLLCRHCNVALGHVKENTKVLEAMIKYLG